MAFLSPVESVDKCTTCATCVAYCPVTMHTRAFNGPKLTGPASERFRLFDQGEIAALDYCSNCKLCDISCPSGVQISALNMMAKAESQPKPGLRNWILAHGHFLAKLTWPIPQPLLNFGMTNSITRKILDYLGIDARAPLPVPVGSFKQAVQKAGLNKVAKAKQVVFFVGCYINDYDQQTGLDFIKLLNLAGYYVQIPDFQCCGVPLIANAFLSEAGQAAKKNIEILKKYADLPLVVMCQSCGLMLKEYPDYFTDIPSDSSYLDQIYDSSEFINKLLENEELKLPVKPYTDPLIYHAPCHLRAEGIGLPGVQLLRKLGFAVIEARAGCCGISGSYGFKKEKYSLAAQIGAELFTAVQQSQAKICLTECGTCRMQISHHTKVKTLHPLSFLLQQIIKS